MASTTSIPTETTNRCDANKVKVGDVYTRSSFGTITNIVTEYDPITRRNQTMMSILNSNGDVWNIGKEIVALEFSFAEQFDDEETVSRTRMIEIMIENPRTAMTINFNKKPDPKKISKELEAGKNGQTAKVWNAKVKALLQGEERVMVGYHTCGFDEHRRLRFNESGKGQRLVDPRTLNTMIVNRVFYTVGK